jgi:APA family basic amino acid/polyamine antiporter
MALNTRTLLLGLGWMALGICLYVLYRRHQGLELKQTVKVVAPEPLGVEEVEYQSVLVAFEGDTFSEEVVSTAKALGARRRRAIHVLALIEVPTHLPLDAPLPEAEGKAQSKIEQAKLIAGQRVSGHVEHVRPGQAGKAIVEDAKAIKAAAIVMPLRYRNGTPLYGRTLQTVLAARPCRVIVSAQPDEGADGVPATAAAEGVAR